MAVLSVKENHVKREGGSKFKINNLIKTSIYDSNAGNILLLDLSIICQYRCRKSWIAALSSRLTILSQRMLFGTDGLWNRFNNPQTAQFIGVIALNIILFPVVWISAAEIKPCFRPGIVLIVESCLPLYSRDILFTTSQIQKVSPLSPEFHGIIVTACRVISSTDSASVFSILRSRQRQNQKARMLELVRQ